MVKNHKLRDYALKQKLHLTKSLKRNFFFYDFFKIFYLKNSKVAFSLDKQVNQMRKVYFFLKGVALKRKPVLFFGYKSSNLDSSNIEKLNFINSEIFKLSFNFPDLKNKKKVLPLLDDFYKQCFAIKRNASKPRKNALIEDFFSFNKKLDILIKENRVARNGYFLQNWLEGIWSNIHCLKPSIIEKSKNVDTENFLILSVLNSLYECDKSKLPGAVIFFSREGYDLFFKEFRKMGIPIICIVGFNDSFIDIDYPLVGDSNSLDTSLFYIALVKQAFTRYKTF